MTMTCSSAATYAECVIVEHDRADYAVTDALDAGRSLEVKHAYSV